MRKTTYNKICYSGCPYNHLTLNNDLCVTSCPLPKYRDDTNKACVDTCPNLFISYNHICYNSCPYNHYQYGKECMTSCPAGTKPSGSICAAVTAGLNDDNSASSSDNSSGLSGGAIAGIVVGCVVGVAIIAIVVVLVVRSKSGGGSSLMN